MSEITDDFANSYLRPFGTDFLITVFAYTDSSPEVCKFVKDLGESIGAKVNVAFAHPYGSSRGILTSDFYFPPYQDSQRIEEYVTYLLKSMLSISKSVWCSFEGSGFSIGGYSTIEDAESTYAFASSENKIHTAFFDRERRSDSWLKEYRVFIDRIIQENPTWPHLSPCQICINSFL